MLIELLVIITQVIKINLISLSSNTIKIAKKTAENVRCDECFLNLKW